VYNRVVTSPEVPGIISFFKACAPIVPICVVSGTPVDQLLRIVKARKMVSLFHELHSIPPTKDKILRDILIRYSIDPQHAIYIGDRNSDLLAAKKNKIPFIGRITDCSLSGPKIYQCRDFTNIQSIFKVDHQYKKLFLLTKMLIPS
jgi:hypothetical protein